VADALLEGAIQTKLNVNEVRGSKPHQRSPEKLGLYAILGPFSSKEYYPQFE